jgi:hypothetical protein
MLVTVLPNHAGDGAAEATLAVEYYHCRVILAMVLPR